MSETGLHTYVAFWKKIYESADPIKELEKHDGKIPSKMYSAAMRNMSDLFPEPYYGYMNEDISNDVLLLLLNPSEVHASEEKRQRWNDFIQQRYQTWEANDYLGECATDPKPKRNCSCRLNEIHDDGCKWRKSRWLAFERIIGQKVNFMHTMEFFPYHSKNGITWDPSWIGYSHGKQPS